MRNELVKVVHYDQVAYYIHVDGVFTRLQPAFNGYYKEHISEDEYIDMRKSDAVDRKIPLDLFNASSQKILNSIKSQLKLESPDTVEEKDH